MPTSPAELPAEFIQAGPRLGNPYDDDRLLQSYLRRKLPKVVFDDVEPELRAFGDRIRNEIEALGDEAEANPPVHVPYDPWGRRIDEVRTSAAWKRLREISAEEGLIEIGYTRDYRSLSRIHQHAKLYLFAPAAAVYNCPLAMTDGAARLCEVSGDADLLARAFGRLTSRDPERFWISGQWMTERAGGSDVGASQTIAVRDEAAGPDMYRLYGTKWFTSAIGSDMVMTLARPEGAPTGSRGLDLFYLELRGSDGKLQGIRVDRLKDKLGTRALPTAELTLDGTLARRIGEPGKGVRQIAVLMNVTRIWNANAAVAGMRHGFALATAYARERRAFGAALIDQPLHRETLAGLAVELHAAFHLLFRAVELQGLDDTGEGDADQARLLRTLTPLLKLVTAKQGVAAASETLEAFGGAGYVEDTGLPRLLRDAQVLPIWEGTTNVLSLDLLRAIAREDGLRVLLADVQRAIGGTLTPTTSAPGGAALLEAAGRIQDACGELKARADAWPEQERAQVETGARAFALGLARTYQAALLVEHAVWAITEDPENARSHVEAAIRFARRPDLVPLFAVSENHLEGTAALLG